MLQLDWNEVGRCLLILPAYTNISPFPPPPPLIFTGKYLLVRDPTKPQMRIYALPGGEAALTAAVNGGGDDEDEGSDEGSDGVDVERDE